MERAREKFISNSQGVYKRLIDETGGKIGWATDGINDKELHTTVLAILNADIKKTLSPDHKVDLQSNIFASEKIVRIEDIFDNREEYAPYVSSQIKDVFMFEYAKVDKAEQNTI